MPAQPPRFAMPVRSAPETHQILVPTPGADINASTPGWRGGQTHRGAHKTTEEGVLINIKSSVDSMGGRDKGSTRGHQPSGAAYVASSQRKRKRKRKRK
eukprot:scaffold2782_cov112-Isochrysis_galbana.AAC.6